MALPQGVLEQLQRESPKSEGWAGQLLAFSGTILFISLIIYAGLVFGYKKYLDSKAQELQAQIQAFGAQIPAEEQTKIINFYSQLSNLKTLLSGHVITSPLFDWLEKNTQANVFYTKFNLNTATGQLTLGGSAKSMDDLNRQIAVFERAPEIKSVRVGSVSSANNLWQFDSSLVFADKYFYAVAAK